MEPSMKTPEDEFVFITSPTTIPKNQDIVISWKTDSQEILGYEIHIGTEAGQWDVLSSRLRKDLREIRLPDLPQYMTPLYVEFGYLVPSDEMILGHDHSENVLLCEEPLELTRI